MTTRACMFSSMTDRHDLGAGIRKSEVELGLLELNKEEEKKQAKDGKVARGTFDTVGVW